MTAKPISPHMQVWVTAVALIVGFLCGLYVSYKGFFRPGVEQVGRRHVELSESQMIDRSLIRKLGQQEPQMFDQLIADFDSDHQSHFREVIGVSE